MVVMGVATAYACLDDIPTLAVMDPEIVAVELVALARPGKSKSDTRRLIRMSFDMKNIQKESHSFLTN